jgi:proline-specific peptidase
MALPDSITYPRPPGQERPCPKPTKTGKALFKIPNRDLYGETAYEIYGDLESSRVPLIALHSGPGIPHTYLLPLSLLLTDYGIPIIMYDQIGCGSSTRFPDHMGDKALWTPELFMVELDNLKQALGITTFDLLGRSWGGMLAAQYVTTQQPIGLRKLILCNCLPSRKSWMKIANELREALPKGIQEVLIRCEKEGKTDSAEYKRLQMSSTGGMRVASTHFLTSLLKHLRNGPRTLRYR